ncbi:MAG: hypothetical protein Q7R92_03530 [bacterium]|nr:hypothetical protein [bacterium]
MKKTNSDRLGDRTGEIAEVLKKLPDQSQADIVRLLVKNELAEVRQIIRAINKILVRVDKLSQEKARQAIKEAHSLNKSLAAIRQNKGLSAGVLQ